MKRASARSAAASAAKKAKLAEEEVLAGTGTWHSVGDAHNGLCPMLYRKDSALKGSKVIAGFDIDWTVIATQSGRQFPTGPSDWKFLDEKVPEKLQELHKNGTKVVFFTNQGGMEKGKTTPKQFQTKADTIIHELGFPVDVYVSTGESNYRKPSPEMWQYMAKNNNDGVAVDMEASVYVGDAAGRPKGWKAGAKKDFSCSDRMFAANVGVPFKTPEEFFFGEKPTPFEWRAVNPVDVLTSAGSAPQVDLPKHQELVLLVGMPASGKSTFAKRHFVPRGYVHVNRDTLGTSEKCLKVAREAIQAGKSVVVDNTNPAAATRADYVDIAKAAKVSARCFYLDTSADLAHHLNYYRQTITKGADRRVPDVGYRVFQSKFEKPTASEGFVSVTDIPFVPEFKSDTEKDVFKMWT